MTIFLTIVHVLVCVLLIVAVLIQSGKGGGLAASVGGGLSSSSVLGGRAASTFLTKVTTYLASAFLVLCLILAVTYDDNEGVPTSATERMMQGGSAMPAPAPYEGAMESGAVEGESPAAIPE